MFNEKEIAQNVVIKEVEVVVGTFVNNGVEQQLTQKAFALACPRCGEILHTFQVGTSQLDILKSMSHEDMKKVKDKYCSSCGQKLTHYREPAVDTEIISIANAE